MALAEEDYDFPRINVYHGTSIDNAVAIGRNNVLLPELEQALKRITSLDANVTPKELQSVRQMNRYVAVSTDLQATESFCYGRYGDEYVILTINIHPDLLEKHPSIDDTLLILGSTSFSQEKELFTYKGQPLDENSDQEEVYLEGVTICGPDEISMRAQSAFYKYEASFITYTQNNRKEVLLRDSLKELYCGIEDFSFVL